jgi:hypothetical protein
VERGEVYSLNIPWRDPRNPTGPYVERFKMVVVLRGGAGTATETDVPVVLTSTDRRPDSTRLRSFEVLVGTAEGFDHDTIIDCRWPQTVPKQRMAAVAPAIRLDAQKMREVSIALFAGLQMQPPT